MERYPQVTALGVTSLLQLVVRMSTSSLETTIVPLYFKVENDTVDSRVPDIMKLSINNGHGMWPLDNSKHLQLLDQPAPDGKCSRLTFNLKDPAYMEITRPDGGTSQYNLDETFYYLRIPLNYNQLAQPFRGLHKLDQISVPRENALSQALIKKGLQVVSSHLTHQQYKYRILTDADTFQDMVEAIMCENMIIYIGDSDPTELRHGSYTFISSSKSLDEQVRLITEIVSKDEWKQSLSYIRISKMDLLNDTNIFVTIAEEMINFGLRESGEA